MDGESKTEIPPVRPTTEGPLPKEIVLEPKAAKALGRMLATQGALYVKAMKDQLPRFRAQDNATFQQKIADGIKKWESLSENLQVSDEVKVVADPITPNDPKELLTPGWHFEFSEAPTDPTVRNERLHQFEVGTVTLEGPLFGYPNIDPIVGAIEHETAHPLAIVLGYSEHLAGIQKGFDEPDKGFNPAEIIKTNAQALTEQIKPLLHAPRLQLETNAKGETAVVSKLPTPTTP